MLSVKQPIDEKIVVAAPATVLHLSPGHLSGGGDVIALHLGHGRLERL
jgi:hypothetical protein